jgi:hypothetical protein
MTPRECTRFSAALFAATVALALAACKSNQSNPTGPTPVNQRLPMTLNGTVFDTAFRLVPGARVEVIDAVNTDESTVTGDNGQFSFPNTLYSPATVTATKDGFIATTQQAPLVPHTNPSQPQAQVSIIVSLQMTQAPVDLTGSYAVTFDASGMCPQLPAALLTRTYGAAIAPLTPLPGHFQVTLTGNSLDLTDSGMYMGVAGDAVSFGVSVYDKIGPGQYLAIGGRSVLSAVSPNAHEYDAQFSGYFGYCSGSLSLADDGQWCVHNAPTDLIECQADTRFMLTRQ